MRKMLSTTGILSKDLRMSPPVVSGSIRGSLAIDQQRDINACDIEAWKKVASDAKIEVK